MPRELCEGSSYLDEQRGAFSYYTGSASDFLKDLGQANMESLLLQL